MSAECLICCMYVSSAANTMSSTYSFSLCSHCCVLYINNYSKNQRVDLSTVIHYARLSAVSIYLAVYILLYRVRRSWPSEIIVFVLSFCNISFRVPVSNRHDLSVRILCTWCAGEIVTRRRRWSLTGVIRGKLMNWTPSVSYFATTTQTNSSTLALPDSRKCMHHSHSPSVSYQVNDRTKLSDL